MQHGNPSIEAMLAHRAWIQRLAQRLVADPNDAQDVVQETWLAALRNPPPDDRSPRGWLARVAHNAARQLARRASARGYHERAAPKRDAAPSTADLVERISAERSVVEDVTALPEPYRRAILLRYFDELAPTTIAAQTGVPLATVKTRLQRGLAMLRERLDRRHGGDASTWLLALTPIAMKGGASSAVGTGVLLMSAKSSLVWAAALVALVAGFFRWRELGPTLVDAPEVPVEVVVVPVDELVEQAEALESDEAPDARASVDIASVTGGRIVRVVSALDDSPLAGADVWFVESAILNERRMASFGRDHYDPEPDARELGRHLVCDERGEATLPRSDEYWTIIARKGELSGRTVAKGDLGDDPVEVRCAPDRTIAVQVVDGQGAPLPGVPVGLREDDSGIRWTLHTRGPEGMAVFRHMRPGWGIRMKEGAVLYAVLAFPHAGGVAKPVDLQALDEPIRLVAPETGRLVVQLVDGDGAPYVTETWVKVTRLYEAPGRAGRPTRDQRHSLYLRDASRAVFPHVGLGFDVLVAMQGHGIVKAVEQVFPGPTRPGEERQVTLRVGDVMAHFSGRIVGASGAAFELQLVDCRVEYRDGDTWKSRAGGRLEPLGDDRFLLPLSERVPEGAPCRLSFQTGSQDVVQLSGHCEATAPADGDEHDCGTIVLAPAPLVVGGLVTDQEGRPLPLTWISLGDKLARQPPVNFVWSHHDFEGRYTDDEGRFEMRGELERDDYAIWPRCRGYTNRGWVPFEFGDGDVRIVLDAETELVGRIITDEGFPAERLTVVAQYSDANTTLRLEAEIIAHVQPDGRYALGSLRPGTPDLIVRTGRFSTPLATIEGVEVTPGGGSTDERVARIDLRKAVFKTTLEIVAPDGTPVRHGSVSVADLGVESGLRRFLIEDGQVSLITPTSPIDVEVRSPGLVSAKLVGIHGDTRVVLAEGLRVRITLPHDIRLPEEPYVLRVGLLDAERADWREDRYLYSRDCEDQTFRNVEEDWSYGQFVEDRTLELGVPHAGTYDVRWQMRDFGGAYGGGHGIGLRAAAETGRLAITAPSSTFELAPDRDGYDAALASIE